MRFPKLKAAKLPTAVRRTWKFVKGDEVMIMRGKGKGSVAPITSIKRDGITSPQTAKALSKRKLKHKMRNPQVYLQSSALQVGSMRRMGLLPPGGTRSHC
jgi:hypothetical protein